MTNSPGWILTVALGLLLIGALSAPVAAHRNYLAVDTQVTADGTIHIEGTFLVTTGYVVLHADDAGQIGDVIDHVKPEKNTFYGGLSVAIDRPYWANVTGNTTVWAVLHHDAESDGEFHPSGDPPIGGHEEPSHAVRVPIRRGDQSAYVLAEQNHAQKTNMSTVTVRQAHLPTEGYLVIRANEDGKPGDVVGHRSLSAGLHENVTVPIDEHAYHHRPEQFSLWAVVYQSDSDSTFDDSDTPVAVNGSLVTSQFYVERTGDLEAGHKHTSSPAETTVSLTDSPTETTPPTVTPTSTSGPGLGILSVIFAGILILVGYTLSDHMR